MKIIQTKIPGVIIFEPQVFGDQRGFFCETFRQQHMDNAGIQHTFLQDNHSRSHKGVLRGLHAQIQHPQGKLVRVSRGEVYDVAVDIRQGSPTWGQWVGIYLNDQTHKQLYIPPGLLHGFCVISDTADFQYKCTDYFYPDDGLHVQWNDPQIGINWPIDQPELSQKDQQGKSLNQLTTAELHPYQT